MIYLEIGSRACPLRYTARSLLRTRERGGKDVGAQLKNTPDDTALLLYAALCDHLPRLTLSQAQSILHTYAQSAEKLAALMDALARAYDESGFPPEGISQQGFDRLLDAAARAGMARTHTLYDLTYSEIVRELNAFLARQRLRRGLVPAPVAMTDEEMQQLVISMTRRDEDAHD